MKRIDIQGMGVWIEVFKRNDNLTELEMLKEAAKAIVREVIRRESITNNRVNRPIDDNELPQRAESNGQ